MHNRAKQKTKESIRDELSKLITNEVSHLQSHYADELSLHLSNVSGLVDVMHQTLIAFPPDKDGSPKKTVDLTVVELSGFFGLLSRELLIAGHLLNAAMEQCNLEEGGYV